MTEFGETLTRGTVWVALTLYVGGEAARRTSWQAAGPWLNGLGCAAFLAHVACAFQFYHYWSHAAAYAQTALQTAELTGWNSGVGLYVNYFFGLVWLATVIKPPRRWTLWAVRGFFWFMIFNGAAVFVRGPIRWLGLLLCLLLIGCWWPKRRSVGE